jgi:hypothetical protein
LRHLVDLEGHIMVTAVQDMAEDITLAQDITTEDM